MTPLTNAEAITALFEAGVASPYHAKLRGLHTLQNPALKAKAARLLEDIGNALALGVCHQISYDGREALDFAHLLTKALLLGKGVAVRVMPYATFANLIGNRNNEGYAEKIEGLYSSRMLILLGAMGKGANPYAGKEAYEVEWCLRNWLLADRALIMQGEVGIEDRAGNWWSSGFIDLFTSKLQHTFAASDTLPKG